MGVYIKGMEMPKSCPCEVLGIGYDLCCSFAGGIPARVKEYYECCQNGTRPSWCPLGPVPPHGDLIDRGYAIATACSGRIRTLPTTEDGENWIRVDEVRESIKSAPTIIPAEEGET